MLFPPRFRELPRLKPLAARDTALQEVNGDSFLRMNTHDL